eukprot:g31409.t1
MATAFIPHVEPPPRVKAGRAGIRSAARDAWAERDFGSSVNVYAFGSSVNGFGDTTSDVDLVISIPEDELRREFKLPRSDPIAWMPTVLEDLLRDLAPMALSQLSLSLSREEGVEVLEEVLGAKVPILKLQIDGVDCDLSCNNLLPVFNSQLLRLYADRDPRVVRLATEVKTWAREKGVHGAFYGNLSSYSFVLLVIFYMQHRGALPCLQQGAERTPLWYSERGKETDAGRPHAQEFQWGRHVASVRVGQLEPLDHFPDLSLRHVYSDEDTLHIEDPFDIVRNLTCVFGPSANRTRVKHVGSMKQRRLVNDMLGVAPGEGRKLWFALKDVAFPPSPASPRTPTLAASWQTEEREEPEPEEPEEPEELDSELEQDRTKPRTAALQWLMEGRQQKKWDLAPPRLDPPYNLAAAQHRQKSLVCVQDGSAAPAAADPQSQRCRASAGVGAELKTAATFEAATNPSRGTSGGLILPVPKRGQSGESRRPEVAPSDDLGNSRLSPSNSQNFVAVNIAPSPSSDTISSSDEEEDVPLSSVLEALPLELSLNAVQLWENWLPEEAESVLLRNLERRHKEGFMV